MRGRRRGKRVNDVYAFLPVRAKAEADRKALTIGDLAVSSTIPEPRIRDIFEGRAQQITLRELVALSMALDIPVTELISPLR